MALDCSISNGYQAGCAGTGGITEVYIGNWEKFDYQLDPTGLPIVTSISSVANSGQPIDAYRIEQKSEWAGAGGDGVHNQENDTVHQVDNLTIKATTLDAETLAFIKQLRRANTFAIVRGVNGYLYILGADIPGRSSESSQGLGTALEDMDGGSVTIEFKSKDGMYLLDENSFDIDFNIIEPTS